MSQYDAVSEQYAKKINPTKQYALIPTIESMLPSLQNKSVLDLGCGDGYITRALAQLKPACIKGLDISTEMIKLANNEEQKNPLGITYQQGDILHLDLAEQFDVVTAIYLLDYASTREELDTMTRTLFHLLKEGGTFAGITVSPRIQTREEYKRGWQLLS